MNRALDIAVVGVGGVFPAAADTHAYWQNIASARSAIADAPPERWIAPPDTVTAATPAPDKALGRKCGLVRDFVFDPAGFALPPEMLQALDPLYHLVLQAGREAAAAGCLKNVDRQRTGTILAAIALPTEGSSALAHQVWIDAVGAEIVGNSAVEPALPNAKQCLAARVTSLPAALLAAALALGGGSYTLDAACASSLYAVRLACDALAAGRLDAVLAGGVSRPDCLYTQIGFSQLRALSPSGRCAPFDAAADGLVVGEGAGIVVLKRLSDALAQEDHIYGVIRAVGLSNDIRGNLLAPDSQGQVRAMQKAYRQAGWHPGEVDLVECHGAGTPVGDRTEIESLHRLMADHPPQTPPCAIGSVKSMIGHLLTAAGAAGLIKVLLALDHQILPPSLNFETPLDPRLDGRGPFRVQTAAANWQPAGGRPSRRAAVSAFGFGGINAHLLVEEWTDRQPAARPMAVLPNADGPGPAPVAIVGMAAHIGPLSDLTTLAEAILSDRPVFAPLSARRWRGLERMIAKVFGRPPAGCLIESIDFPTDRFRIPPSEIPDILVQQLLMLQVAAEALADAGLAQRARRRRMGVLIGIEFDPLATDFHLRWRLKHAPAASFAATAWPAPLTDAKTLCSWLNRLADQLSPALTHSRTVGNLGGIVASRLAREFGFGGPSFGVSADAAGGLQALEIAVRFLQQGETDLMLAGAVDLTGDLRRMIGQQALDGIGKKERPASFSPAADGTLPGEGALALVLKRLDDARRDGDRIYAVIQGLGTASGPGLGVETIAETTAARSLAAALAESGHTPAEVDFVEVLGSGIPRLDTAEKASLNRIWPAPAIGPQPVLPPVGAVCRSLGYTGAAAGLTALMRAALGLDSGQYPPSVFGRRPAERTAPQVACAGALSTDGNSLHVILSAIHDRPGPAPAAVKSDGPKISIPVTRPLIIPPLPEALPAAMPDQTVDATAFGPDMDGAPPDVPTGSVERLLSCGAGVARAHNTYLDLSQSLYRQYADAFALQGRLLAALAGRPSPERIEPSPEPGPAPAFDRNRCLEFARGKAANVLGTRFAEVDTFPVRVRLPDEPLMLVDRILAVEGKPLSLDAGRVVTEHDVLDGAWYLDGARAPVCITVEAGQADLFLCSYLGIDHQVRGLRSYRLLDARVRFHRGLPRPGETVRYDIRIDRFVRQADTWLFFFRYEGTIDGRPVISMRDGCAGFFTPEEVRRSGGIVLTEAERHPEPGRLPDHWTPPVPLTAATLSGHQIEALRRGDLGTAFGDPFTGIVLPAAQRLPGGRMRLIHRVRHIDPTGGRYGIGTVVAEADIAPDDWFLTCHFVDDMVMPGTLMYECCAHALRVFVQRLGWISLDEDVRFEPVPGIEAVLRCRGPVTPATRQVVYRVDIREIGDDPAPYVVADAHMDADGEHIVMFRGMSLKLSGTTRDKIEAFWHPPRAPQPAATAPCYTYEQILAFSVGRPSAAFGAPYRVFDTDRRIARLPGPPYLFMDRVVSVEPEPWQLAPGGWVTAEYEVPPEAWYFRADRSGGVMPFCVLLEVALQPCGWLAAYLGSALRSEQDLKFRNLGGKATLHRVVDCRSGRLTMRARLKQVSEAGAMIIETFVMEVADRHGPVYSGETTFGFFTARALANQVGLRDAEQLAPRPSATAVGVGPPQPLADHPPLTPDDGFTTPGIGMPSRALRMIDTIEVHLADGGPDNLGFVRGTKQVDPTEWFFTAHFFQDPVCPGSLGIESFLQLLRHDVLARLPPDSALRRIEPLVGSAHRWTYRGQIVPDDRQVTVEAIIRERGDGPEPFVRADGLLSVDGRHIYHMQGFGVKLIQTTSDQTGSR